MYIEVGIGHIHCHIDIVLNKNASRNMETELKFTKLPTSSGSHLFLVSHPRFVVLAFIPCLATRSPVSNRVLIDPIIPARPVFQTFFLNHQRRPARTRN